MGERNGGVGSVGLCAALGATNIAHLFSSGQRQHHHHQQQQKQLQHGMLPAWSTLGRLQQHHVQRSSTSGACGLSTNSVIKWQHLLPTGMLAQTQTQECRQANAEALADVVAHTPQEQRPLKEILSSAGKKALGGGIPGMAAMAIQVASLMWLRTTINYQYRYGLGTTAALKTLYREGGIPRFYRGVLPALVQGPMSRFGDTAANSGALALLDSYDSTKGLPVGVKTMAASFSAGLFRIVLMPVDAMKTMMQVEGKNGLPVLGAKIRANGPLVVYHGALAASAATFVGHYPWFATYNYLNEYLPQYTDLPRKLARSAVIGFCASAISDTCSNSIRVVKTTRQTATEPMTYPQVVRSVVAKEGLLGLFGRGLKTKILANGLQGLLFSVLWRLGMDYYNKKEKERDAAKLA